MTWFSVSTLDLRLDDRAVEWALKSVALEIFDGPVFGICPICRQIRIIVKLISSQGLVIFNAQGSRHVFS